MMSVTAHRSSVASSAGFCVKPPTCAADGDGNRDGGDAEVIEGVVFVIVVVAVGAVPCVSGRCCNASAAASGRSCDRP
jgi:hypothetical protein